jgi:capsular exopolysaccharide synthesis family protein
MKNILPPRAQRPALPSSTEADSFYASPPEEKSLHDYWGILVQRRNMVVVVFLIVLVIGGYFSFTATPLYYASSILKIEPQNPSVTGVGEMLRLESGGPQYDYYQTQFMLLRSNRLAAKVITELKLDANKIFTNAQVTTSNPVDRVQSWIFGKLSFVVSLMRVAKTEAPQEEPESTEVAGNFKNISGKTTQTSIEIPAVASSHIGRYKQFLEVKPIKNTRLVEIAFSTPNPRLSQQLADAHARGFIQLSLENRFALTKDARDFLDGKNAELKQKLERSEDALNRFRQTYGVVSMEKGENIVVERLVDLNRQLTAARGQRIEAETLYRVVENKSTQSLSQVVTQGMVPALRSNLLALEAEKVKSSSIFKPDHPRMVELNQQISEMKRSLNTEISNVVRGIQESFFAARSKEQALQAEAQKQQQAALNLKEVGVQYAVLEEEVKVNRTLYESVLKRLNETNISNDIAISNMQITQNAERPRRPFTPNIPLNLLSCALLGFFLGVSVVFVRECFDSSIHTPQHVWRAVALSTFGVIPDLNSLNRRFLSYHNGSAEKFLPKTLARTRQKSSTASKELIISHHPLSILSESYRSIRTALLFSQPEKPPKVILVTSPAPGEGKTISTLNLAIALAQDGHDVLVIDADLRKGSCHARLGIKNHNGLSNVLTGNLSLEEAIRPTSVSRLSLLSRGICPPNPTDLLGSEKMRHVLGKLRESFNFILIDSPPTIAVSDAAVLSIMSDGVILVFHGQKTTMTSARQALERLDAIRAPILGVVLNGVDLANPEYAYYRHYYGSDYGSGGEPKNGAERIVDAAGHEELPEDEPRIEEFTPGTVTSKLADIADHMASLFKKADESLKEHIQQGKQEQEKPFSYRDRSEGEISGELGLENVPREFFDHMTLNFSEAVGPMGPLIVARIVRLLGESRESFPRNRLMELLERVDKEIPDDTLRKHFKQSMQEQLKAFAPTDLGMKEISSAELAPEKVPRQFFDHMASVLCEAAGPMAPLIIRDQIDRLGESLQSFPKTRLKELVDRVCSEILNQKLRRNFQQTMSSEIRAL